MPLIETEEAARRLARAIASDLSLYNEEKIVNGITNDNLFTSLAEEIEEGRALYKKRVAPELYPKNYYDRALVDIVIKGKAGTAMAAFGAQLGDTDIAAVVTYERNAWTNKLGEVIQPAEVTARRSK